MIKEIKKCPYCNRKSVGVDEFGNEACVYCDYFEGLKKEEEYESRHDFLTEEHNIGWRIYDELICGERNPSVRFISICSKLKGHKGNHVDSEWKELPWENV